eukprot:16429437-Heterocapsa_arctica.AAC.1
MDRFQCHGLTDPLQAATGRYRRRATSEQPQQDIVCIHALGPNFTTQLECTQRDALVQLTTVYMNIFSEFAATDKTNLRTGPISGGLHAGHLIDSMPRLTLTAI